MAKLLLDKNGNMKFPTIIMSNKALEKLGTIPYDYSSFEYTKCIGYSEGSFVVYKKLIDDTGNEIECRFWDDLVDLSVVYIREFDEYFEVEVSLVESDSVNKTITLTSLHVAELSQINAYVEINTEEDIDRDDYLFPTVFYNPEDPTTSMLNRLLDDKAPHYSIGTVPVTLRNIQRTFSWNGTSIWDAFGDIEEEVGCKFLVHGRVIDVVDMMTTCNDCGYRGDFLTECPKCNGTNVTMPYGDFTNIYVSRENLSEDITLTTEDQNMKNCFRLEAGDEDMTAAVVNLNPSGSRYIYHFSDKMKERISSDLRTALNNFESAYEDYRTRSYSFDSSLSSAYDALVTKYNDAEYSAYYYNDDNERVLQVNNFKNSQNIDSYEDLISLYYDALGFYNYLNSTLMPSAEVDITTSQGQLDAILDKITEVGINNYDAIRTSNETVASSIKMLCGAVLTGGFRINVTCEKTETEGVYDTEITVTNYSDDTDTATDSTLITVSDDYELFFVQKMAKLMRDNLDNSVYNIIDFNVDDNEQDFIDYLKHYDYNDLDSFSNAYSEAIDLFAQENNAELNDMEALYRRKYALINTEMTLRESEVDTVNDLLTAIETTIGNVKSALDLNTNFLITKTLQDEFNSYRREDSYENSNFISEGLSDTELIARAIEFYDLATQEVENATRTVYNINATLHNLLLMPEFKNLWEAFEVCNWIAFRVDDKIFRLRILSYNIRYDENDITTIDVDFTTATEGKTASLFGSTQQILQSAKSMATSFPYIKYQTNVNKISVQDVNALTALLNAQLTNKNSEISTLTSSNIDLNGRLIANEIKADRIEADYVSTTTLDATEARINNLIADKASVSDLTAATGRIGTLETNYLTVSNTLEAHEGRFDTLEADTAKIHNLTANQISAATGYIADLTSENITAQDLVAMNGTIENLDTNYAHITNSVIDNAYIDVARVNNLDTTYAHISNGTIDNAYIDVAKVNNLDTNYAKIENGTITNAYIDYAKVRNLDTHYAEIDLANVNNAWVENGAIKKASIFDGNVFDLSGNTATLTRIDASKINVANLQADNLIVRRINGQPVVGGYTLVDPSSSGYSSKNPQTLGWYEFVNAQWVLSTDTTVDATKAYYQKGNEVSLYDQAYIDGLESSLQQQIDGAVETFTGTSVPTLVNYPYTDWYDTSVTPVHDERAKHVGDIYYVVNEAVDQNGYCYRFAYDNTTHAYNWVLIKDSDVTKALSDISDLQEFESNTTTWKEETDEGLETIRTNHTTLSGVVDKTVKETIQLWFTKADTTSPTKPNDTTYPNGVTSTSTDGNAWRKVVPAWNASYPNYFYCWQYKFVDNTYDWSDVVRDIAMSESQGVARSANALASAALPKTEFTNFETTTFKDVKDSVDEQSTTITNMTTRLGLNSDGTAANTDIVAKESKLEQTIDGISTRVGKTEAKLAGMYATSSTAAGTAAKTATIIPALSDSTKWELSAGTMITVKFTTANTTTAPTLNVNSKGAKSIRNYAGNALGESEYKWKAGDTFTFVYDGTYWRMQDSTTAVRMASAETSITQTADSIVSLASNTSTYTKPDGTTGTNLIKSAIDQQAGRISMVVSNEDSSSSLQLTPEAMTYIGNNVTIEDSTGSETVIQGGKLYTNRITVSSLSDGGDYSTTLEMNTAIGEAIDDLEIGGRNLLLNTGNETESKRIHYYTTTNGGVQNYSLSFNNGETTLTSTSTSGEHFVRFCLINSANNVFADFYSTGSREWVFSGYVKSSFADESSYLSVRAQEYDDSAWHNKINLTNLITGEVGTYRSGIITILTGSHSDWVRFAIKITILDDVDITAGYISFQQYGTFTVGDTFSYKQLKLELGNKATDWSPAPEDVDISINDAIYTYDTNTVQSTYATKANAIAQEQRVYYKSASSSKPASPTSTWVTKTNAGANTWTTYRMPYDQSYPYLYTCIQKQTVSGTITCTTVLLDDTTTVIDGGKIITGSVTANQLSADAIKSNNYVASSTSGSPYSSGGTFLDLSNGNIYTPNFGVQAASGTAYLNGEIIATSGTIGDDSGNYWSIGNTTVSNGNTSASIIGNGTAYIQDGYFQISNGSTYHSNGTINTQWYAQSEGEGYSITYPYYDSTYWDFGISAPILDTSDSNRYNAITSDNFLYIRKHANTIPVLESDWTYTFKVDKDGDAYVNNLYVNGTSIEQMIKSGVNGGAYLSTTSGGTVNGDVTIIGTLTATASKATADASGNTITTTYMKLAGTQTNSGTNTFSGANTFSENVTISKASGLNYSGISASSTNSSTYVWFSKSGTNGTPVYDNDFKYNPSTNVLTVGSITGTAAKATADASGNTITTTYATKADTVMTGDATAENLTVSGTLTATLTGNVTGNVSGSAGSLTTNAGSATQPIYFSGGVPVATTYALNKTVPSDAVFTDTNWYHSTGTWNGLKYTAGKSNTSMSALEFTIPTGTTATTVALGNHTHNYASKVTLAGTDYSSSSNAITITKANLQSAIQDTNLVLMTAEERSKLSSIQVSSGGTIDFSGVTASTPLTATVDSTNGTVNITHDDSGATAGTYRSVTVDAKGHVTGGTNPTTISGYGITDAKIASGVITLGSNTITPLTASSTLDATKLSGTASISTTGNASTASALATSGTIRTNLASTTAVTYTNGGNITPGVTGTLAVGNGGTGQTTAVNAANAFLNALSTGSATPQDADYYISQYAGGGTTTTTYHRRPMSKLWEYIKGKMGSDSATLDNLYVKLSGAQTIADVKTFTSMPLFSAGIRVNNSTSNTGGISLYSTKVEDYGIAFRGTTQTNSVKHGYVQGDWAIYNFMTGSTSNVATRGWIYKDSVNDKGVASISGAGNAVFNGSITAGGNADNTTGCEMVFDSTKECLNFIFH